MKNTLQDIQDTYNNLDLFGEASELEAATFVDEMSGDGDETHPDDANIPDSLPLPDALNLLDASRADGFQFAKGVAEELRAQFVVKSEDVKGTADSRVLHANMALAIKTLLVTWGSKIAEAEERVQQSTPDERRKMGVNPSTIVEQAEPREPIICGPSSLDETPSRPASVPSAVVQRNTRAAQDWLKKSDATRS
jgi:hypothetical protein